MLSEIAIFEIYVYQQFVIHKSQLKLKYSNIIKPILPRNSYLINRKMQGKSIEKNGYLLTICWKRSSIISVALWLNNAFKDEQFNVGKSCSIYQILSFLLDKGHTYFLYSIRLNWIEDVKHTCYFKISLNFELNFLRHQRMK